MTGGKKGLRSDCSVLASRSCVSCWPTLAQGEQFSTMNVTDWNALIGKRWRNRIERDAFKNGWIAASQGKRRIRPPGPLSYNERAAFMDGWHSFHEASWRCGNKRTSKANGKPERAIVGDVSPHCRLLELHSAQHGSDPANGGLAGAVVLHRGTHGGEVDPR